MNCSRNENSPEVLFKDYRARRSATIMALTIDAELVFQQCDPEKDNMCLYGHPDEEWELIYPDDDVPPDIPEPVLGINFVRDLMKYNKWLSFIATHTDSWLLSVSFYYAARCGYDQRERMELFDMINELPTVRELVIEYHDHHVEKKKRKRQQIASTDEDSDDIMEAEEEEKCGACGKNNGGDDEVWICCDGCDIWFHCECVMITPSMAEKIKIYKCPACNKKRPRV